MKGTNVFEENVKDKLNSIIFKLDYSELWLFYVEKRWINFIEQMTDKSSLNNDKAISQVSFLSGLSGSSGLLFFELIIYIFPIFILLCVICSSSFYYCSYSGSFSNKISTSWTMMWELWSTINWVTSDSITVPIA